MKYALFLFLFMSSVSCSLPAAEKDAKVAAVTLEEELKLEPCKQIRCLRYAKQQLLAHAALPAVLVDLIGQYVLHPKPTVIATSNHRNRNWQVNRDALGIPIYFYLFTPSQNILACKEIYFSIHWQRSQSLRESALAEVITKQLPLSGDDARGRMRGNTLGAQSKGFEQLGIDKNAVWCLKNLLSVPFRLVAKNSNLYQAGEKRSALLLDSGYSMYEWCCHVQKMYEKIVAIQQVPAQLALISAYDQDHLTEFVQTYKTHGAQFVQACEQIDENEDLGLLFGEQLE